TPLPGVPKVRVLDVNGKIVLEGYYMFHEARQINPVYQTEPDRLSNDELQHLVLCADSADWGMPKAIRVVRVTPPERIEVIK
ncbi:MAG: hypothetical protein L0J15_03920, partial [Lactococcus sp.]|nr:hypothetical protein [Lactococcus sp.]